MNKIFSVITSNSLDDYDFNKVNVYLEKNPNAEIKSITPVAQHGTHTMRYYGVVIVIDDKNIWFL